MINQYGFATNLRDEEDHKPAASCTTDELQIKLQRSRTTTDDAKKKKPHGQYFWAAACSSLHATHNGVEYAMAGMQSTAAAAAGGSVFRQELRNDDGSCSNC